MTQLTPSRCTFWDNSRGESTRGGSSTWGESRDLSTSTGSLFSWPLTLTLTLNPCFPPWLPGPPTGLRGVPPIFPPFFRESERAWEISSDWSRSHRPTVPSLDPLATSTDSPGKYKWWRESTGLVLAVPAPEVSRPFGAFLGFREARVCLESTQNISPKYHKKYNLYFDGTTTVLAMCLREGEVPARTDLSWKVHKLQ